MCKYDFFKTVILIEMGKIQYFKSKILYKWSKLSFNFKTNKSLPVEENTSLKELFS